ncbi:MAG: hypothetical protein ACEY3D_09335 [Rickettsia sp.]|uniref:hypothetical protein n=1 Tax=Rickettsia sp. TaxID=789 RepID=UPI00397B5E2D
MLLRFLAHILILKLSCERSLFINDLIFIYGLLHLPVDTLLDQNLSVYWFFFL